LYLFLNCYFEKNSFINRAAKRIDGIDDADAEHKGRYCFWRDSIKKKFDESLLASINLPFPQIDS